MQSCEGMQDGFCLCAFRTCQVLVPLPLPAAVGGIFFRQLLYIAAAAVVREME